MTKSRRNTTPSLLEPQSRGGDEAEAGFSYQEHVILSRIPLWLSQDGFTTMVREAIGDTEAKFFVPGHGFAIEFVEAKNYALTPGKFWAEIRRFREVDAGSPGTYCWFILVCPALSRQLKPLINGLRRVRDSYQFYEDSSPVKQNSFLDYVEVVKRLGYTEEDARFLFEKVRIEEDSSNSSPHGEAMFRQALRAHLPEYEALPGRALQDIYMNLVALVKSRLNQPITRRELEQVSRAEIDPAQLPPLRPLLVYTSIEGDTHNQASGLRFDWSAFWGGEARLFPPPEQWNHRLLKELQDTRKWVVEHRSDRHIKLTGNRRLSASLAVGSVFSAVAGFSIEMEYRDGELWATNAHPTSQTPEYQWVYKPVEASGEQLVVTVGILRNPAPEVESFLQRHVLAGMPTLHMMGEAPILSPEQANIAVRRLKDVISQALINARSTRLHLFYAGPSILALLLGHRLNATAPVQCYERVSPGHYVPTCLLPVDR